MGYGIPAYKLADKPLVYFGGFARHVGFYATPGLHWDKKTLQGEPFFYFAYGAAVSEVLLDPEGTAGRAYDAKTTPHMYIIDKDGTLVEDMPHNVTVIRRGTGAEVFDGLSSRETVRATALALLSPIGTTSMSTTSSSIHSHHVILPRPDYWPVCFGLPSSLWLIATSSQAPRMAFALAAVIAPSSQEARPGPVRAARRSGRLRSGSA